MTILSFEWPFKRKWLWGLSLSRFKDIQELIQTPVTGHNPGAKTGCQKIAYLKKP
jgi:hypothetical protein